MRKKIYKYFDFVRPSQTSVINEPNGFCDVCGVWSIFSFTEIINNKLAAEWGLNKKDRHNLSARESMYCVFCGCSYRLRMLGRAITIITTESFEYRGLESVIDSGALNSLNIAEINSCGVLHNVLKNIPKLLYSEYMPKSRKITHQDLMNLSYQDNKFDIVLTSDTLEHIPDPERAIKEVYRILKPGGKHIFTTPALLNRTTKQRAKLVNDKKINIEPESFHGSGESDYLVWNEFGGDLIGLLENAGFIVKILFQNSLDLSEPSCVFVAHKPPFVEKRTTNIEKRYVNSSITKDIFSKFGKVQFVEYNPIINKIQQTDKINQLQNKLNLTAQHSDNQAEIIHAYNQEIEALRKHIHEIEEINSEMKCKIERFNKSVAGRLHNIFKKIY